MTDSIRYGCNMEDDVKGLFAVVEVSDHAGVHHLWADYANNSRVKRFHVDKDGKPTTPYHEYNVEWQEQGSGWMPCIDRVLNLPITCNLNFATIEGHRILFWYCPSQLVFYPTVETWLEETIPNYKSILKCDADDFYRVIHAIEDAKKEK